MTTIKAEIIADSIHNGVPRITTMYCRYPLVVHAEVMTHRVFSRNARSSRAVPIQKMIDDVIADPFVPLHWGAAQKGMQADNECDAQVYSDRPAIGDSRWSCRERAWLDARDDAVSRARAFMEAGYAKQVANRLLAPFLHIDTLITSTEWQNFFDLRDHRDAEPHIQILAREMKKAMAESTPRVLPNGYWHLPYVTDEEVAQHGTPICRKLSVARCARISYRPFDGNARIEAEIARYDALVGSQPIHASPAEHQANPDSKNWIKGIWGWEQPDLHGNLTGWKQLRRRLDLGTP